MELMSRWYERQRSAAPRAVMEASTGP